MANLTPLEPTNIEWDDQSRHDGAANPGTESENNIAKGDQEEKEKDRAAEKVWSQQGSGHNTVKRYLQVFLIFSSRYLLNTHINKYANFSQLCGWLGTPSILYG